MKQVALTVRFTERLCLIDAGSPGVESWPHACGVELFMFLRHVLTDQESL